MVQDWLKQKNINNYTTNSDTKAPSVERAIRTIRRAMARYFTHTNSQRWLEFLPQFVSFYNNRVHSTTKQRPLDVVNEPYLINASSETNQKPWDDIPPVGSLVRMNKDRGIFEKESRGTWSLEVFKVVAHNFTQAIPMVKLEDLLGEEIKGSFYPEEVQKITWDGEKQIEEVIATRKRKGRKEYFVRYKGWPDKFAEWTTKEPI